VRFDGHVVMNIDKLPPPETEPAAPEPAPPPAPAHAAKTRPGSSKSANSK
jgi:hypothetical protein